MNTERDGKEFDRIDGDYEFVDLPATFYQYEPLPRDHVDALFNLVGEHRKCLEVDYTKSPVEVCRTVVQFMQKYDDLPQPAIVCYTSFLLNQHELLKQPKIRARWNFTAVLAGNRDRRW